MFELHKFIAIAITQAFSAMYDDRNHLRSKFTHFGHRVYDLMRPHW